MSAECRGVFEDVIIAGCQAALRFFMFPSGCVFDAEAERQTDSVTAVQKSKKKIVVEENFLRQKMKKRY